MNKLLILLFAGLLVQSCKKKENDLRALSSLTVVNAAIDAAGVKTNTSGTIKSWAAIPTAEVANYANSKNYGVFAGTRPVTVVIAADTTKTLYSIIHDFKQAGFNTLFLCGQVGTYEGVYLADDQLPNYSNEVVGIRFINLSPNSPAVDVVLTSTPTVNEASGLAYKQKSEFKTYPTGDLKTAITFQVKNAATGVVLATYSLSGTAVSPYTTVTLAQVRYKNLTLVIKGLAGTTTGTNAFGVFPVPHY